MNETALIQQLTFVVTRRRQEVVLKELGHEQLEEIDYQRDALQRDVEWGRIGRGVGASLRRRLDVSESPDHDV